MKKTCQADKGIGEARFLHISFPRYAVQQGGSTRRTEERSFVWLLVRWAEKQCCFCAGCYLWISRAYFWPGCQTPGLPVGGLKERGRHGLCATVGLARGIHGSPGINQDLCRHSTRESPRLLPITSPALPEFLTWWQAMAPRPGRETLEFVSGCTRGAFAAWLLWRTSISGPFSTPSVRMCRKQTFMKLEMKNYPRTLLLLRVTWNFPFQGLKKKEIP